MILKLQDTGPYQKDLGLRSEPVRRKINIIYGMRQSEVSIYEQSGAVIALCLLRMKRS